MGKSDQVSESYLRQLFRKGWLMIVTLLGAIAVGVGGAKKIQDFAEDLGVPGWALMAMGAFIITSALHVAQYRLWKSQADRLQSVTLAENLLDKHDQELLRWLRREVGQLIEVFNSGLNINDVDWRTIEAAPRSIREYSAKLRHLGEISETCQSLTKIVNRKGSWIDQGATEFDFVLLNAEEVAMVGSALIAECDRLLLLHTQASLLASKPSAPSRPS